MEHAQRIVADIVARCKYQRVDVSETLAAFAVRMVLHRNKRKLVLEKEMADDDQQFLVDRCVHVLLQQEDPALETVKMQLEFDFTYAQLEESLRQKRDRKEKSMAALQRTIASLVPQKPSDFETLTTLYRHIFTLLMLDADAHGGSQPVDRSLEKEVAAALESVFPRIGLKTFVAMSTEDKQFQLAELVRIVEGIRLFNKALGKGGVGIQLTADEIQDQMLELAQLIKHEVTDANEVCTQYTEVLLHAHHNHRDEDKEEPATLARWQDELANRRQFLSYLQSLDEDISCSCDAMETLLATFRTDLSALTSLVGARTSLPKSQVYPLFEAVSKSWRALLSEHARLQARSRSLKTLLLFKDSCARTLADDSDAWRRAKQHGTIPAEELFEKVETFTPEAPSTTLPKFFGLPISNRFTLEPSLDQDDDDDEEENPNEEEGSDVPVRMPVDTTPEFMQLPLEYQGFCAWTIVERGGLLLPGDPSLGVVQYRNAYHVFVNERALQEFMVRPRRYARGVQRLAALRPSLIYLLRLQDAFPHTGLRALLALGNRSNAQSSSSAVGSHSGAVHPLLAPPPALKVDASTSTPTHFCDKRIDYQYDWNEWTLRRKALQIANLRHCKTVSCQTSQSLFRREVDTQVYLPQENATQTGKDKGTNPPRVTTYFAGLRSGKVPQAESKHDDDDEQQEDEKDCKDEKRPVIVSYSFEL
jgi:hypothetical protein